MIMKQFAGSDLNRAARRALGFWYEELISELTLMEFVRKCSWKKVGDTYVVIYRGPAPKGK